MNCVKVKCHVNNNLTYKFNIGEIVRVLHKDDIMQTLGENNSLSGLFFMDQMWEYCGQQFKIKLIVKNIFFHQMVTPRAPLYIIQDLNGHDLRCKGKVPFSDISCDRYCNLVWHENWLQEA